MAIPKFLLVSALLAVGIQEIYGHGKMIDPINRSSMWRYKKWFGAPANNEDNENFCGGFAVQYNQNGGKCGPCGDNYKDAVPRKNENGGLFGKGYVVKKYKAGSKIKVVIDLSANHLGHFEFSICKLSSPKAVETEECFAEHPLKVVDPSGQIADKYPAGRQSRIMKMEVLLPEGLTCDRCVLRWHYRCGNNWGVCNPGSWEGRLGCGDQEIFRSCSDIAIE